MGTQKHKYAETRGIVSRRGCHSAYVSRRISARFTYDGGHFPHRHPGQTTLQIQFGTRSWRHPARFQI